MTELWILIAAVAIFAAFLVFGRRTKPGDCGGCCVGVEQAQRALQGDRLPADRGRH